MPLFLYALAPLLVLAPALSCVAPRSMAALYLAFGTLSLIAYFWQNRRLPAIHKNWFYAIAAFVGYGAFSQLWTVNPDETMTKAFELGFLFTLSVFLYGAVQDLSEAHIQRVGQMIVAGLMLGSGVYLFEYFNDFPLYDLVRGGHSADVADIKQNKAVFLLALWFYLSFPFFVPNKTWAYRIFYAALYGLLVFMTFVSKSASAQIIIVAAPFIALAMWILPKRLVLATTLAVTILTTVAMPFGAIWVYSHTGWATNDALNNSVKSRVEIWNQAASRSFEKPLLGWGLDASPKLPNREDVSVLHYANSGPRPIAHLHPHNAPIQIWFEMGALGVAGFIGFFVFLYRRIMAVADKGAQTYGAFLWTAAFLYTLSIWGIWQGWFTATLCFMAVIGSVAVGHFQSRAKI
ncbi:MAG: O-antigen ligase family protein [Proteobacteria bacterium]|nr:O-antigen ligase family protein [Pseudomonadota bacterium]